MITKQNLLTENARLKADLDAARNHASATEKAAIQKDEEMRDRLCYVLGLPTVKSGQWGDKEKINRPWVEIFCEVGKLLERKKQENLEDEVFTNRDRLMRLEERIRALEPKDSPF